MRVIPTFVHGILDYLVGIVLLIAPNLFGFAHLDGPPVTVPRVLGIAILVMALLTRYELGLVKMIPMSTHLLADFFVGVFLAISPWLYGFRENTSNVWMPHLLVGLGIIAVSLMSQQVPRMAERPVTRRL